MNDDVSLRLKGQVTPKSKRPTDLPQVLERSIIAAPGPSNAYEEFKLSLPSEQRPFARRLFQMDCEHIGTIPLVVDPTGGDITAVLLQCPRCQVTLKNRLKMARKLEEWQLYCPTGYDAWDWDELFTPDKSLWKYIYDEVQEEMVSEFKEAQ